MVKKTFVAGVVLSVAHVGTFADGAMTSRDIASVKTKNKRLRGTLVTGATLALSANVAHATKCPSNAGCKSAATQSEGGAKVFCAPNYAGGHEFGCHGSVAGYAENMQVTEAKCKEACSASDVGIAANGDCKFWQWGVDSSAGIPVQMCFLYTECNGLFATGMATDWKVYKKDETACCNDGSAKTTWSQTGNVDATCATNGAVSARRASGVALGAAVGVGLTLAGAAAAAM